MRTDHHQRKYLKDYQPAAFNIDKTDLVFYLDENRTRVVSRLQLRRQGGKPGAALVLDGVDLELIELRIDGRRLAADEYRVEDETLTLETVPDAFELYCEVTINPAANTRLEGLYLSNGNYCTQCEAEGFRCITYYLDRPDVMSVFSTEIHAARGACPILLSNGNPVERGVEEDHHWIRWEDPFPKPSYLFALVAGDLACIEDRFVTRSGREVSLQIYTEQHNRDKCDHAMRSLQKAMRWDEDVFGLEYDLDLYMIVAVDDFNMGAMENKGLNVFNTRYVLASAQTATDDDYLAIEGVIAHEYFHNWTGNRVTCRDWFQLSLKEGLTVFRDQEFSADMFSRAIQRINDVRVLRNHQFAEDAGPMAHPVRPASYQEINNFYTATVYNKGAEVVRMIHCLLGAENFRRGMDLYFERHDGQAVTTDDFRQAMQDASGVDLGRFQRWYEQSGTPRVRIERQFDAEQERLTLHVRQHPGATRDEQNRPFHMPMRLALFSPGDEPLPLNSAGSIERVIDIRDHETRLDFDSVPPGSLISAFRGFSAPIILETDLADDELARLMVCDSDPFNRWEAGQQLACRVLLGMLEAPEAQWPDLQEPLLVAFAELLADDSSDLALLAEMLELPGEKYLAEMLEQVDMLRLSELRESLGKEISRRHEALLAAHYAAHDGAGEYSLDPSAIAARRLKNICLAYLLQLQQPDYFELCARQYKNADNMTDQIACLREIVHYRDPLREHIVEDFYRKWRDDTLVLDKWFGAQGASRVDRALDSIRPLFEHPDYRLTNPNRARSLLGPMMSNTRAFHQDDGAGYEFAAGVILRLDEINPQVAARLANPFVHWRKLVPAQGHKMKAQVEAMLATGDLSNDLSEMLTSCVKD